jgi:hypothetical protein
VVSVDAGAPAPDGGSDQDAAEVDVDGGTSMADAATEDAAAVDAADDAAVAEADAAEPLPVDSGGMADAGSLSADAAEPTTTDASEPPAGSDAALPVGVASGCGCNTGADTGLTLIALLLVVGALPRRGSSRRTRR